MLPQFYTRETLLVRHLAAELNSGRLAIFLGAGLSKPLGLPDWPKLVAAVLRAKRAQANPKLSLLGQMTAFRKKYFPHKSDKDNYYALIRRCLYGQRKKKIDFSALQKNTTLSAIGALVMASLRGSVSAVVTLNFDDFLESYLRFHGLIVASQASFPARARTVDVRVIHPHGLLPYQAKGARGLNVVFDDDTVKTMILNVEHPLRQEMLTLLRKNTWLFIGLSGDDDHLESLLEASRATQAVLKAGEPFWGVAFGDAKKPSTVWKANKISYFRVRNYHKHLPGILFKICQEAALKR